MISNPASGQNEGGPTPPWWEYATIEDSTKPWQEAVPPPPPLTERFAAGIEKYTFFKEQGDSQPLPENKILRKNMSDSAVILLRQCLQLSQDLSAGSSPFSNYFDGSLEQDVKSFQKRHGLRVDGAVGAETIRELNVPAAQRLDQLQKNFEHWQSQPLLDESFYILINLAAYELRLIEQGRTLLTMPVVVGRPEYETPEFKSEMTQIILNPSWNIPTSITVKEILPVLQLHGTYLENENIKILQFRHGRWINVSRDSISWSQVDTAHFPYLFRQPPGPLNPLGRFKFILPNPFGIYLHDTPAKFLFENPERRFSHGCIRIAEPLALARKLIEHDNAVNKESIFAHLESWEEFPIVLTQPVPILIVYLSAWVEEDGTVQFRKDKTPPPLDSLETETNESEWEDL